MKVFITVIVGLSILACTHAAIPAAETTNPAVIQQIVEEVKPSLVRIHVVQGYPEEGRETKSESFGSGVIISPDGYVVTNHHVAGNARWLSVTLSNKEQVEARLVGTDPLSDIAVIKLAPSFTGSYPAARWGDASKLRVGDPVLAMGSPLALSQSVTAGIVSNTELVMPASGSLTIEGEDIGSIVLWIGHDAAIHPGNSGGPLVNLHGEIVGINEIELGLSGAIPGNLAREVSTQLIEKGKVARAFTGFDLQPRLRQDRNITGVLVSGVMPGSPAAVAGIRAGDILLSIGEVKLDAKFPEQLPLINLEMARLPVGKPISVTLLRRSQGLSGTKEQRMSLTISPTVRDLAESPSREVKGWSVTGSDITPFMAQEYRYPGTHGVLVTTTASGGPAAEAKPAIEPGDVILAVGGKPVTSLASLKALTDALPRKEEGSPTLVEVWRTGERFLTVVEINKQNEEDTSIEVAKAWLPVSTQVVTRQLVEVLRLPPNTQGVRVTQVHRGSAAELAGLKVGDIITRLDGLPVEASQVEDMEVFPSMIRQYKIGTLAKLSMLRNGKPLTVSVKLPQAPKRERELATYRDDNFGLTMRSVTYWDRARMEAWPNQTGALITAVDKGSWAALSGLATGDIIHRINGTSVIDMESARARLQSLERSKTRQVVFFIARGMHTLFLEAQTDWSLSPSSGLIMDGKTALSATASESKAVVGQ